MGHAFLWTERFDRVAIIADDTVPKGGTPEHAVGGRGHALDLAHLIQDGDGLITIKPDQLPDVVGHAAPDKQPPSRQNIHSIQTPTRQHITAKQLLEMGAVQTIKPGIKLEAQSSGGITLEHFL